MINYAPDVLGRPTQASGYITSVGYWPSGQIRQMMYANGTGTAYNQNDRLWPSLFTTAKGNVFYNSAAYTYDGVGNLLTIKDAVNNTFDRTLGYDGLDRLTKADGPWGTGSIAYDGKGNITNQTFGSYPLGYTYNANNVLTGVIGSRKATYTYDVYGNISQTSGDVSASYTWDDAPNLRCVNCTSAPDKIEYAYDGLNQRVSVTKQGVKTYEVYGIQGNLLAEYTPSLGNKLVEYIYVGGKRIATHTRDDFTPRPAPGPPRALVEPKQSVKR